MFWLQAGISFAAWVGFGIFQSLRLRTRSAPNFSLARGVFHMLLGALALFVAIILCVILKGLGNNGFAWWAWMAVTLGGLAFVGGQMRSMAILAAKLQDSVTSQSDPTSDLKGPGTRKGTS